MKEKRVIKIVVTESGKDSLTEVAKRYDMKEYAVASRIYDWFFQQDDIYQRAVLFSVVSALVGLLWLAALGAQSLRLRQLRRWREARERQRGFEPVMPAERQA